MRGSARRGVPRWCVPGQSSLGFVGRRALDLSPAALATPLCSAAGNHGGKRLSRRHIRMQTDGYLRKAGLRRPGISNHSLRHTADTLGYLHTGDLRALQDFLGHADPRMTAKYAHVVDMAKKNPALFIPVKVGPRRDHTGARGGTAP